MMMMTCSAPTANQPSQQCPADDQDDDDYDDDDGGDDDDDDDLHRTFSQNREKAPFLKMNVYQTILGAFNI